MGYIRSKTEKLLFYIGSTASAPARNNIQEVCDKSGKLRSELLITAFKPLLTVKYCSAIPQVPS